MSSDGKNSCRYTSGQTISTVSSFDFVDDFLSPSPGSLQTVSNGDTFDVVDSASGGAGTDGVDDFRISWSATGLGDDGNNVTWDAVIDINGTGLRSTINPAFVGSGGVSTNNSGHVATQTIQIDFLSGVLIEADNIDDLGWSSGNTAGTVYESSVIQYLDITGNPFSAFPSFDFDNPLNGPSGDGTLVASDAGSVTQVGTDLTVAGSNGSNNSLSTSFGADLLGISSGTVLGGVRITQIIEDTRGINNGDTIFTNTINDFDLVNFQAISAIPEPSSALALVG